MWSLFKGNKFIVDTLVKSRTYCGGYNENVITGSSTKILVFVFMKKYYIDNFVSL